MQNRHVEVLIKRVALVDCGKSRFFCKISWFRSYTLDGSSHVGEQHPSDLRLDASPSLSWSSKSCSFSGERMKLGFHSRLNARMGIICRITAPYGACACAEEIKQSEPRCPCMGQYVYAKCVGVNHSFWLTQGCVHNHNA